MSVIPVGRAAHRATLPALPDLAALKAARPTLFPCLLESAARGTERGRFDLLLASNGETLRLDRSAGLTARGAPQLAGQDFLTALDDWWRGVGSSAGHSELPFQGGWALYLGYELVAQIEPSLRPPPAAAGLPIALALRCPAAVVIDHQRGEASLIAEAGHEALLDEIKAALHESPTLQARPVSLQRIAEDLPQHYVDGVRRALDYIRAGDVFQVNLSRAWQAELGEHAGPADLYQALRQANPAPFGAWFSLDPQHQVISSSPERLVARRGRRLETRPIAGTRARLPGDDDAARVRELIGHPKERAEHIMLIDLERNDLGRVSETGSVKVDELMAVESYAHVHHIESTVSGIARPGVTPGQLIRAVFPGGTITGCPKVRCMEIIAELEGEGRGPYTGAVGWLDRSGDLDLNILIRTLWTDGSHLHFRAGAGVVADSDPDLELAETRAKARGLLRALGCEAP